jgi:hypothetical protein
MVGTSETKFNANADERIDLQAKLVDEAKPSDYESLTEKLRPALSNLSPADLNEDDIAFLAGDTGADRPAIETLRQSARLARETGVPAEVFYGLASQKHPIDSERLLKIDRQTLKSSIEKAVDAKAIPAHFKDALGPMIDRIEELKVDKGLLTWHPVAVKLVDQSTNKPLPAFVVRVIDPVETPKPREITAGFTDEEGLFSFNYLAPREATDQRQFEFRIYDQEERKVHAMQVRTSPGQKDPYSIKVSLPRTAPASPNLTELASELGLRLTPEILAILRRNRIATLSDVLASGSLTHLKDLEKSRDDLSIKQLDAHARLGLLSTDPKANEALIEKGYTTVHAIAKSSFEDIEKAIGGKDALKAAQIYNAARHQARYLGGLTTAYLADRRNGFNTPALPDLPALDLPEQCGCKDCESAVSPLAYLADLLDYAITHVEDDGSAIDLSFLETRLHQPFGAFPASCSGVENQLRQVRIAVEVLRSLPSPSAQQALNVYVLEAYKALLVSSGTSYDELRLATANDRETLVERLAIQRGDGTGADELSRLLLTQNQLTERNLERLFGLHDTLPAHRLSRGAKLGDSQNQLEQWTLTGITWGRTTDADGRVYVTVEHNSSGGVGLRLFADRARTKLIASGNISGTSGTAVVAEEGLSGVAGELAVNYQVDSNSIEIAALPELLSWRLNYLRMRWMTEDWPQGQYLDNSLPIIDPDLIGPDDLRRPLTGNIAFDLWQKRRDWVDALLNNLRSQTTTTASGQVAPDFQRMRDVMVGDLNYDGFQLKPWSHDPTLNDLEQLHHKLVTGEDAAQVKQNIVQELHLTPESLGHLMAVKTKNDKWENGGSNDAVTTDEWASVFSILAQAQKRSFFSRWREEENQTSSVLLSFPFFWISLHEPQEGVWPAERSQGHPWIDPDTIKVTDLPESIVGVRARRLLSDRVNNLGDISEAIRQKRESSGFEAMLTEAYGDAPSGSTWAREIDLIKANLISSNPGTSIAGRDRIHNELHLSDEDFEILWALKVKDQGGQADPVRRPTSQEWENLYALLTRAKKVIDLFPGWIQEEDSSGLKYWHCRKARLPRWRASADARSTWQQELRARGHLPAIDPDLVGFDNLITPSPGNLAFDFWKARSDELRSIRTTLSAAAGTPIDKINSLLRERLGINNLDALRESLDQGLLSTARLEQLNVRRNELERALRIRETARAGLQLSDEEWNSLYDILLQVEKRRRLYRTWLQEERDGRITLGPDYFQLAPASAAFDPQPPPVPPNQWRTTPADLRNWENKLQSRLDQEKAVIDGHSAAVSAAEEATLPRLRDELIRLLANPLSLPEAAKFLTKRLLMDMAVSGCQMTTRVGQAIETIQLLIWSLRTGQLKSTFPNLELQAPDFDEEWKWLGSFATWRAAMMVFIYPENILIPTLRRRQTPAFRDLVQRLRVTSKLTSQGACHAAIEYARYFRDVMNLEVEATCTALTSFGPSGCTSGPSDTEGSRSLFYMFARSRVTDTIYWSAYDLTGSARDKLSHWGPVPELEEFRVKKIVGATHYQESSGKNWVYLFAHAETKESPRTVLAVVKFRLHDCDEGNLQKSWESGVQELPLPEDNYSHTIDAIVLCSSAVPTLPPLVAIQAGRDQNSSGYLFVNQLSDDGNGWDLSADYSDIQVDLWGSGSGVYLERTNDWLPPASIDQMVSNSGRPLAICKLEALLEKSDEYSGRLSFFFSNEFEGGQIHSLELWGRDMLPGGSFPGLSIRTYSEEFETWSLPIGVAIDNRRVLGFGQWRGLFSPDNSATFYLFGRDSGGWYCQACTSASSALVTPTPLSPGYVISHSGLQPEGAFAVAFEREIGRHPFLAHLESGSAPVQLAENGRIRIAPARANIASLDPEQTFLFDRAAFELRSDFSSSDLQLRRWLARSAYLMNLSGPKEMFSYLDEAYLFVPLLLALRLQQDGEYATALDWFRLVYDYTTSGDRRWIYSRPTLVLAGTQYDRAEDWLADPINPHAIAELRQGSYLRFVLISLVRCFLDFADSEFTQDVGASIARARQLYLTALDLLDADEIKRNIDECERVIGELVIQLGTDSQAQASAVASSLRQLQPRHLKAMVDQIKTVLADRKPVETRVLQVRRIVADRSRSRSASPSLSRIQNDSRAIADEASASLLGNSSVAATSQQIGASVSANLLRRWLRGGGHRDRLNGARTESNRIPGVRNQPLTAYLRLPLFRFCIPANPLISALRFRAELNLHKLRTCRNIAGLERQIDPYGAPIDTGSGLPSIGPGGQLLLPGAVTIRPTLYRYKALVERAKQLAGIAQQMEGTLLSLLEKFDAESYSLLRARQDARVARAGIQLQDLRVLEAEDGVDLAKLQKDRASIQEEHYGQLIAEGISELEQTSLDLMLFSVAYNALAMVIYAAAAGPTAGATLGAEATAGASMYSTASSIFATLASYERRQQDWEFQRALARQDQLIGNEQIVLAKDRVRIVGKEREIAEMHADHADELIEFLNGKFTDLELYHWMIGILEGVYRYFLQQTTAVAKLAENQLAFERQQVPPGFIQADYWIAGQDAVANQATDDGNTARRGLTGSARLLQDIYRLDQYAFETDQRKLQLVKIVSLARLDPFAFQQFRERGVMVFSTPMEMFDRDFPGHYLRLIKRVRTSVIALIPSTEGIKATLTTIGISRVVIGGDSFQTTVVSRPPESVALTSPVNATGLFELEGQSQSDVLLPFEGLGVDTTWELRMPKAANLFDYTAIADVLITIEYTALDSFLYRQQVIQGLNYSISSNRAFSFRHQFADQWYDFHHPALLAPPQQPMVVQFTTRREDFPPNLNDLTIQHLALYFVRQSGSTEEIPVNHLRFTEQGQAGTGGGSATTVNGVISTRQGNAASWAAIIGKRPFGEWELALTDTESIRSLFDERAEERIEDILFVITYAGRLPGWPS